MAEAVKEKKKNWFVRFFSRIARFFKDIFMELKKVSWPNGKQVVNKTGSVLIFCLIVGAVIWLSDFFFQWVIGLLYA